MGTMLKKLKSREPFQDDCPDPTNANIPPFAHGTNCYGLSHRARYR